MDRTADAHNSNESRDTFGLRAILGATTVFGCQNPTATTVLVPSPATKPVQRSSGPTLGPSQVLVPDSCSFRRGSYRVWKTGHATSIRCCSSSGVSRAVTR